MNFLQLIEERFQPFERSISRMIQCTLEYPASVENRAAKITNDTIFLFKIENEVPPEDVFMSLWAVLVEMSWRIPAGHEWQRCLLLAIRIIRQREGAPNQEEPFSFSYLCLFPNLLIRGYRSVNGMIFLSLRQG